MYEKPSLSRYGTFREVTRGGPVAFDIDTAANGLRDLFFHTEPSAS